MDEAGINSTIDMKIGVKKDGTITAVKQKAILEGGAYSSFGVVRLTTQARWFRPFTRCRTTSTTASGSIRIFPLAVPCAVTAALTRASLSSHSCP